MKIFISSVFELFVSVVNVINLPTSENDLLKQEWNDVFAKDVNLVLIKNMMILLGI